MKRPQCEAGYGISSSGRPFPHVLEPRGRLIQAQLIYKTTKKKGLNFESQNVYRFNYEQNI
jgi:hypothetical protein